ncbi:MAG: ATP-binding protein [Hyphomicrobiales bacterium]
MVQAVNAFAAIKGFLPFFGKANQTKQQVNGHATIIANPAYQRLLKAEPLFRKFIPFSIITFLILIGLAKGIQISDNREATLVTAQENLTLIATLVEKQIEAKADSFENEQKDNQLIAALADFKPQGATKDGRVLLILDTNGRVLAEEPISKGHKGTYLADILEPTGPLLTFGERAGVMSVAMVATQEPALVTVRQLNNKLGYIAVYQPKEALLAQWRADVNLNSAIFLGTGILLILVLYAFFTQTSRADEADLIYHQTYARFDTALERGKCGLWDWDVGRGRFFWSPSMFEILGYTPRQTLLGFGELTELIHPKDVDLIQTAEAILSEELSQVDLSYRMRHADGHWVWVRARGEVVPSTSGEAPHLVGICIDISDQMRLKKENKTANIRLRESIESLSEAFVLWDSKNRLVVCNKKYRELNGLPSELAVSGTPYDEVMSAVKTPHIAFQSEDTIKNESFGRIYETELSDGRWLQIAEHRTDDNGYMTIGTDITRIKKNEEKLRLREQELQASVEHLERSQAELQNLATLYDTQRAIAQNANHAKAEFLANISHEWRTPLNAIIGFSDVMRQGAFGPLGSEKYLEYCNDINESGTYMLSFINDVIDMSDIETGQFKLDPEEVDATEILNSIIAASSADAKSAGVTIKYDATQPLNLEADRRALKQIFQNLLSNSLKFNHHGGSVNITCHPVDGKMAFSISDTGIGIPSSLIDQLGTPFKQVQSQHTKNHTGSGLGLSISKSLVEMHGGELLIQSQHNEGTQVTVKMPLQMFETFH